MEVDYEKEYRQLKKAYKDLKNKKNMDQYGSHYDSSKDYEKEYRQMKKAYLNLKNQKMKNSNWNGEQRAGHKKEIIVNKSDKNYVDLIDRLDKYCREHLSFGSQLGEELKDWAHSLKKELGDFDIGNIFENKPKTFDWDEIKYKVQTGNWDGMKSDVKSNWDGMKSDVKSKSKEWKYHICQNIRENIIPYLEQRRFLQAKLIDYFNQSKISGKIYIDKYLHFAKEHGLISASVDTILYEYGLYHHESNVHTPEGISGFYGKSKNNHDCITPCATARDLLGFEMKTCNTEPYKKYFKKWNWDFCE